MKVLTLANHKGGVGKTTTVLNLGPALTERGVRVLLVDLDPQGNLSEGFGLDQRELVRVEDVLVAPERSLAEAIVDVGPRLSVAPSSWGLTGADEALTELGPHYVFRLRELLEPLAERFDVVLVDTPPSLSTWSGLGLLAADAVIVPITPADYDHMAAAKQIAFIEQSIRPHNPTVDVLGVLVTKSQRRWRLLRDVESALERDGMPAVPGQIPWQLRVASAVRESRPTFWLDPDGKVAYAYREVADYVVRELGVAA